MNRIQRVRRFRLASLALSLGAVLAVSSLPAAAPALAATGDSMKITSGGSSAITAGPVGSTFVARVASNTVNAMGGIQATVSFNNTFLEVTSFSRPAGFWGSAPVLLPGTNPPLADINAAGKLDKFAASYISTPGSPTGTDVPFLDITFRVKACPVDGNAGVLGLGPLDATGSIFTDATGAAVTVDPAVEATVTCTPPAANEFALSVSQATVTVGQGGTGATNVTATLTSGTVGPVTLSTSGVPADVTATFGANPVTPTGGTSLTFSVAATAVVGSYPIVVTGTPPTGPPQTVNVTLVINPPPAGPVPATGSTTISGVVDSGFLGLSVDPNTQLRLRRNAPNEQSVPVLVFSNTQWSLSIEDALVAPKPAGDRGKMTDPVVSPQYPTGKRLSLPMKAYVPVAAPALPLVRTLDVAGPQSLTFDQQNKTVNVTINQLTTPSDPPGNYSIDLLFSAISGF